MLQSFKTITVLLNIFFKFFFAYLISMLSFFIQISNSLFCQRFNKTNFTVHNDADLDNMSLPVSCTKLGYLSNYLAKQSLKMTMK